MIQKFRPYFTAAELLTVINTLKSSTNPPTQIIRYLETFAIKIERGVLTPSISLNPPESIESRLGLAPSVPFSIQLKEDEIENKVTLWESYPESRHKFSPLQLEKILSYRYENNRMSPEEETEYERSIGAYLDGEAG